MSLAGEQIERWSRQIVLPEVGGRGQEQLLASVALVGGSSAAAVEFTASLLARAGVQVRAGTASGAEVAVTVPGAAAVGTARGGRVRVGLLVGRPCADCIPPSTLGLDQPPGSGDVLVAAALVAAEALRAVLLAPERGRVHTLDLGSGRFGATTLTPTGGCARCGGAT
jgi:hypothetical protein